MGALVVIDCRSSNTCATLKMGAFGLKAISLKVIIILLWNFSSICRNVFFFNMISVTFGSDLLRLNYTVFKLGVIFFVTPCILRKQRYLFYSGRYTDRSPSCILWSRGVCKSPAISNQHSPGLRHQWHRYSHLQNDPELQTRSEISRFSISRTRISRILRDSKRLSESKLHLYCFLKP